MEDYYTVVRKNSVGMGFEAGGGRKMIGWTIVGAVALYGIVTVAKSE